MKLTKLIFGGYKGERDQAQRERDEAQAEFQHLTDRIASLRDQLATLEREAAARKTASEETNSQPLTHEDFHELRTLLQRASSNVTTQNGSEFSDSFPRLQELAQRFIHQHEA